jgi:D-alanine-D-alanine ligase
MMAGSPQHVLHLVGSAVDDFHADLSRVYAEECLDATADPSRYRSRVAYVSPDGTWRLTDELSDAALAAAEPMPLHRALERLDADRPDVVVPQMFCGPGMTHYRALFELLGVPSVGNPATVMAVAADKAATRAIVANAGVRVPDGEVVRPGEPVTLPPPVVVKPVASDNSVGVSLVRDDDALAAALAEAFEHGEVALVERYVELGREVRCGTVVRDGHVTALPLEEYAVDAVDKPVRDRADKLARDADGQLHLMAKDPTRAWIVDTDDPITAAVAEAAIACHRALGCAHHGLFDFRIDGDGDPWFLEAGPYCSFGRNSVVPTMAAAAGIPVTQLFAEAVDHARGSSTPLPSPRGAPP